MATIELARLRDPFPGQDIEWRIGRSGEKNGKIWATCLAYVDNRAIMDRLDDVCGPENWRNEFREGPGGGVLCGICLRIGDEWVCKWDGAENTDIEGVKGGISGSMKRAAVQWGIGRYLYNLEEGFADISENGKYRAQTKDKKPFRWSPPALPGWALPVKPVRTQPQDQEQGNGSSGNGSASSTNAPNGSNGGSEPDPMFEMLRYIQEYGPKIPRDAEVVTSDRKAHNLRGYIREQWETIKSDRRCARMVVDAIKKALRDAETPEETHARLHKAYHAQMTEHMKQWDWSDESRHDWQEQAVGKRSCREWSTEDYRTALEKLNTAAPQHAGASA